MVRQQRADAPANRRHLMETARRIFAERGLSTEVKDIAAEAGLGIGTFYRNFPSKDDLISALVDDAVDEMREGIREAEELQAPAIDRIECFLMKAFALVARHGWLLEALWTGQLPRQIHHKQDDDIRDRVKALFQKGIDNGELRPDLDTDTFGAMLVGPLMFQKQLDDATPEQAAARLMDLLLNGAARRS